MKIAVFIDFDNIEIGVKSTLNRHFDVGTVLEAIKERGEVVTKVAYGDWKRAGEHSRSMTQHAIQMVQRNLTPGGDKNGADINLALDALEMAFTRNHINAFVIVGGDSDFMALVEKLKQYDKKVMVVGGRSFTSTILQKNCHEFIAYENLITAPQSAPRRPAEKARVPGVAADSSLSKAAPLVARALKVLTDREVSPQLGLLKSTLLQLDSTFSERDYGASTFRDFIEKMAAAGYVNLKQVDRSLLVELKDGEAAPVAEPPDPDRQPFAPPEVAQPAAVAGSAQPAGPGSGGSGSAPIGPTPAQAEEGIRSLREVFQNARVAPHWPMYLRNVRQYVKNAAPSWDERRYGFVNFLEAVRAAQRSGLFRLERNRQGILRIFPGNQFPQQSPNAGLPVVEEEIQAAMETVPLVEEETPMVVEAEPILEAAPQAEMEAAEVEDEVVEQASSPEEEAAPEEKPARTRRAPARKKPSTPSTSSTARPRATAARRPRKKPTDTGTDT